MKKILSKEMAIIESLAPLYNEAKNKKYNYTENDFEVIYNPNNSKHYIKLKSWNTAITNADDSLYNLDDAWRFIREYIEDCKKPYGNRKLKFHLISDNI